MASSGSSGSSKPILKMPVLAPPKLGAQSSSSDSNRDGSTGMKLSFPGLKQSKLSSAVAAFGSTTNEQDEETSKKSSESTEEQSKEPAKTLFLPLSEKPPPPEVISSLNSSSAPNTTLTTGNGSATKAPKENSNEKESSTETSSSGFVFGQNLYDRAENFQEPTKLEKSKEDNEEKKDEEDKKENHESSTNDSSNEQKKNESDKKTGSSPTSPGGTPTKSLSESAAEYYESHAAKKRKYEEVTPVTGEEDEINVVQMNAKLHVFDKGSSNWIERGRGTLRLNDYGQNQTSLPPSRLVMRTAGSLRVILNTALFSGMTVERPSEKTVRLTGTDEDGSMKIFLVGGAVKDVNALYNAVISRIKKLDENSEERKKSKRDEEDQQPEDKK